MDVLLFESAAFLLGLLFGSFLNVCISRLPMHRSIVKPGSHCPKCLATIRWYDNIPLLSWVLLAAKCRHCKQPISWRYPAVELMMGMWFAYASRPGLLLVLGVLGMPYRYYGYPIALSSGLLFTAGTFLILGFLLLGLMVMDWETRKLPDTFTLGGTLIGFLLVCVQAAFLGEHQDEVILQGRNPLTSPGGVVDKGNVVLTGPEHLVLGRLLAIVAAAGVVLAIRWVYRKLRGREGMGLGDAKLMALLAAFLGFGPAMLAFFVGVVLCAGYALTLLVRRRATAATRLPLGTFLCVGGLFAAFFGPRLIEWYRSLL